MNNYWFLYDLKSGAISGSPYLGNVEEWTNIPEGCAVLGPISEIDATDDVKNAFDNSAHYVIKDNELITVSNISDLQLMNIKSDKISEIESAYTNALQAGFTSSASGTTTSFLYDDKAQAKFNKLLSALAAGVLTFPYTVYSADLTPISLTQDELKQLFTDLTNFETELEAKQLTLISKVNTAKTVDEVNVISWT